MKRIALIALLVLVSSVAVLTDEVINLPVINEIQQRPLTAAEQHFLSTVPNGEQPGTAGLREACRQMILANIIHVPAGKCGNYRPGDSVRYWTAYQLWTAPKMVAIPRPLPQVITVEKPAPAPQTIYVDRPVYCPPQVIIREAELRLSTAPDTRLGVEYGDSSDTAGVNGFVSWSTPGQIPAQNPNCELPKPGEIPIPGVTGPNIQPIVPTPAPTIPTPQLPPPQPPVPPVP